MCSFYHAIQAMIKTMFVHNCLLVIFRYDLSWASIEFKTDRLTVCEDGGSVGIRVVRYGWVGGKSQVEFKIKDIPSSMHDDDYFYNRQVVFDES